MGSWKYNVITHEDNFTIILEVENTIGLCTKWQQDLTTFYVPLQMAQFTHQVKIHMEF